MTSITTRTAPAGLRLSHPPSPQRLAVPAMQTEGEAPPAEQPNPATATDARLDAQQAQLTDHEGRLARLEERNPAPAAGAAAADAPAEASAAATQQVPPMVNSAIIYGKLAALRTSRAPQAEAAMPAVIQTSAGQVLDGRGINARHALFIAVRAGR